MVLNIECPSGGAVVCAGGSQALKRRRSIVKRSNELPCGSRFLEQRWPGSAGVFFSHLSIFFSLTGHQVNWRDIQYPAPRPDRPIHGGKKEADPEEEAGDGPG